MNQIITISREFGSGGRELGRRLSEHLGCAYYDQEIVQEIAKRTELSEKYVQQVIGHRPISSFPIHIGRSFRLMPDPHLEQSCNIYREQCSILREMAAKSDCVIVGRCADYILRDKPGLCRVFVSADWDARVQRVCRRDGVTEKEAMEKIRKIDKTRASYYNFHTDRKWDSAENYDLCVSSSFRGPDRAVELILNFCKA